LPHPFRLLGCGRCRLVCSRWTRSWYSVI